MSVPPDQEIRIQELQIFARVGVTDQERARPQRLTVTISLTPREDWAGLDDEIARTADYSAVCEETKRLATERCDRLIETFASELAAHLLKNFPVTAATVELRKFVLPDTQYVAAVVTRRAPPD